MLRIFEENTKQRTKETLGFFEEIANKESTEKWFGYEALNHVLEQGGKLSPIERDGLSIVDVDSVRDIEKARKIILLSKGI